MMVTRCASSRLMTDLMTWRNRVITDHSNIVVLGRIVVTEIALPLLAVVAAAETVALCVLAGMASIFSPCSFRPLHVCIRLLSSSLFTCVWSVTKLFFNLVVPELVYHESLARGWADELNLPIRFTRAEDNTFIAELARQQAQQQREYEQQVNDAIAGFRANIIADIGAFNTQIIRSVVDKLNSGVECLQEILLEADEETRNAFKDAATETNIYKLMFAKAVYLYAYGSHQKSKVPSCFKQKTKDNIVRLRKELQKAEDLVEQANNQSQPSINQSQPSIVEEVRQARKLLNEIESLNARIPTLRLNNFDQMAEIELFKRLMNIGSEELNGYMVTACWQETIKRFFPE